MVCLALLYCAAHYNTSEERAAARAVRRKLFNAWCALGEFPEEVHRCYANGYARVSGRYDCGYARVLLYAYVSSHCAYV